MGKLWVDGSILVILAVVPLVLGNCFSDPFDSLAFQRAVQNEEGACDWYNGKDTCYTCSGLTKQNVSSLDKLLYIFDASYISLEGYQELHNGSISFECGNPTSNCKDYLMKFLCGMQCSSTIIQLVPSEDSGSSSTSITDDPQTTVCQYFADRMWEECHSWKVKDADTGECVSLGSKYGNAQSYYDTVAGGYPIP